MAKSIVISKSANDTKALAEKLALKVKPGAVLALFGELGSGKTTFVQALAKQLGVVGLIRSPTYLLLRVYPIEGQGNSFVHIDLYRAKDQTDVKSIHLGDYINQKAIIVIEWPELIMDQLSPLTTTRVHFSHGKNDQERIISVETNFDD